MGKALKLKTSCFYTCISLFALGVIMFSIIFYRVLTLDLKYNEDGTKKVLTNKETIIGIAYSCGYTGAVMIFGTLYKKLAHA